MLEFNIAPNTQYGKIVIPDKVKRIEKGSFKGSSSLKEVTLASSLFFIGCEAFFGCISLSNISIPSSTKSIEDEAFASCYMLEKIKLPGTIEMIGKFVFKDSKNLKKISFSSEPKDSKVIERIKENIVIGIVYEDEKMN